MPNVPLVQLGVEVRCGGVAPDERVTVPTGRHYEDSVVAKQMTFDHPFAGWNPVSALPAGF
jgi:hypothetical protein